MAETESNQDAFARGHTAGVDAGVVAEQLRRHEEHLDRINGSTEKTARALEALTLAVQRLADQAEADSRTVIATAAALKDAEEARRNTADQTRNTAEQSWSPWARAFAVIAALAGAVGIAYAIASSLAP